MTWIFTAGKCTTSSFLAWYGNKQNTVKHLLCLFPYQTKKLEVVHFPALKIQVILKSRLSQLKSAIFKLAFWAWYICGPSLVSAGG